VKTGLSPSHAGAVHSISDSKSVYVTTSLKEAQRYADLASVVGTHGVVLTLKMPDDVQQKLLRDTHIDTGKTSFRHQGDVKPEWIVGARVQRNGNWVNVDLKKLRALENKSNIIYLPWLILDSDLYTLGGKGSGNFEHTGRPGSVGGSAEWSTSGPAHEARRAELVLPPAWKHVRINRDPKADLQATGIDVKGRTQYRYSAAHSEAAAAEKFSRLKDFNKELPSIRAKVAADLKDKNAPAHVREAAAVITLIDKTGFRIGSDNETGAAKQAYGASTLLAKHVEIDGSTVTFSFTGKKGVEIEKSVTDPALASMLAPRVAAGGRLFDVSDMQVRDYLHSRDGEFKVKDFRTYHGTAEALRAIKSMPAPSSEKELKAAQKSVGKIVAAHLGNTPAVALASYVDPAVWSSWKSKLMKS
jgi:DNA topoisomerase-1